MWGVYIGVMMKFKIRIVKEILEGGIIPKGYGVAYWETMRRVAVCYPIPLNVIVALWKKFIDFLIFRCLHRRWIRHKRQDLIDIYYQIYQWGYGQKEKSKLLKDEFLISYFGGKNKIF